VEISGQRRGLPKFSSHCIGGGGFFGGEYEESVEIWKVEWMCV